MREALDVRVRGIDCYDDQDGDDESDEANGDALNYCVFTRRPLRSRDDDDEVK